MSETATELQAVPVLPGLETQEVLRTEVRRIMQAESKSAAACAREADMASQTFSAWLNGSYAGDNEAQARKARVWIENRRAAQRTRAVMPSAPKFVPTKSADVFMAAFEHAQHAPDLVTIIGAPGVGKTEACEEYVRRSSSVFHLTMHPSWGSPGMLLSYMADVLRLGAAGNKQRMTSAIVAKLRDTRGLLIIDEAQHLNSTSIDQLRTFHDLAGIGVALVRNDTVNLRLQGDGRRAHFAQLYSRVGMRVKRPAPYAADVSALLEAWGVEGAQERSALADIAKKPGGLRAMTKALKSAFMQASTSGRTQPNVTDINRAWARTGADDTAAAA